MFICVYVSVFCPDPCGQLYCAKNDQCVREMKAVYCIYSVCILTSATASIVAYSCQIGIQIDVMGFRRYYEYLPQ